MVATLNKTMPLAPSVPPNPRSAPPKRDTDVKPTTGHVVTKTAFTQMTHAPDDKVNIRVKRACEAKNLATQLFRIASAEAAHYQKIANTTKANKDLSNDWRAVFRQAEKLLLAVPLQIENK